VFGILKRVVLFEQLFGW